MSGTPAPGRPDGAGATGAGRRPRRAARGLLVAWLLAVSAVTLSPAPVDETGRSGLLAVLDRLHGRGLPTWVDYPFVERAANLVMFLPAGALLAVLLPVRRWWLAVLLPGAVSLLVETVQHLLLPRRLGSGWDLAANTAGAVVGAALVGLVALVLRRDGRARRPPGPVTSAGPPASAPPSS